MILFEAKSCATVKLFFDAHRPVSYADLQLQLY